MTLSPAATGNAPAPAAVRAPQDADVYCLSYPKAGRTWLRALMGKALVDQYGLPEHRMLNVYALTRAAGLPVVSFDHDGSAQLEGRRFDEMPTDRSVYRDKRVLLMGRDVRDNLVSAYFQATRRINVFWGPISAFIRHDVYGIDKILAFYRIWDANRQVPRQFEFLRYEDLHRDTAGTLARVLAFLGADIPAPVVAGAVEYCRFENLRQAETKNRFRTDVLSTPDLGDPEAFKVRKGKVGNYAEYLSPEDIAYIDAANAARGCEFTRPAP
jgi:hypothetical protein